MSTVEEVLRVSKTVARDVRSRINQATAGLDPHDRLIVEGRLVVHLRMIADELEVGHLANKEMYK